MILNELIQRSPVRIFEKSIHGGLKAGETGIIAAPAGIGKTSVLVQLALDKLLQGEKVIHVSFSQNTQYVFSWYEDIFDEFTKKKNLDHAGEIKDELVKNRVILNFNQDGVTGEQILKSLRALIADGAFNASSVIIDGYDFGRTDRGHLEAVKDLAKKLGVSVWYSCSVKENELNKHNIPFLLKDYLNFPDVVIILEPRTNHVELTVSKDRDTVTLEHLAVKLDPKTLLILEN